MFIQTTAPTSATTARDPEVIDLLATCRPSPVTFYPADAVIFAQGEKTGPLYLVEFGAVRICRLTADGRRQINSFHFAGEVFGFEAGAEYGSYAESVDGAGIRALRPNDDRGFAHRLLGLALRGLQRTEQHLLLLGRMSAKQRMAAFLDDMLERQDIDNTVMLPMQRNDIADYLGLTFETVSRVLRVLKDEHLIRLPSIDRIEVLDREALADLGD